MVEDPGKMGFPVSSSPRMHPAAERAPLTMLLNPDWSMFWCWLG